MVLQRFAAIGAMAAGIFIAAPHEVSAGISGDYFEDFGAANCATNTTACIVYFPVLPAATAGKFITFSQISCYFYSTQPITGGQLGVTDAGSNFRRLHYMPGPRQVGAHFFKETLSYKVGGGTPRQMQFVYLYSPQGAGTAQCTLVGKITSQ